LGDYPPYPFLQSEFFVENPDWQAVNGNQPQKPACLLFLHETTKEKPQRLSHLYGLVEIYFYYVKICRLFLGYKSALNEPEFF